MLFSRDWEMLCVLSESKNITRAARLLFISQPALTKRIIQLEQEFNTKLIERSVTGIAFTPQGKLLIEYAKAQREQYELLQNRITSPTQYRDTLKIGTVSAIAQFFLPDMLEIFRKEHPNLNIEVYCGSSYDIAEKVYTREYHIGFVRDKAHWNVESVVYNEDHACLLSRSPIDINDLPSHPNISIQTDRSGRQLIQIWWYDIFSKPPHTTMVLANANESVEMIKRGLGYGILIDQNFFKNESGLHCQKLYFKNGAPVVRKDYLIFRDRKQDDSSASIFLDFAEKYFHLNGRSFDSEE